MSPAVPLDTRLTTTWTYIRFHAGRHGTGFGDDELCNWAKRIAAFQERGADAYIYFNNDPRGHALHDAARLRAFLASH